MNDLIVPDSVARLRVQAHEAVTKQVVAGAVATIEVGLSIEGRGALDGQIHIAELVVSAEQPPHRRSTGNLPGVVQPGVVPELARMRNRVERPELLAGPNVVAAHVP